MREYESGATRDEDDGKYDYEGFESPLARWLYAAYMHQHRYQKDGTMRAADNWQLGIPKDRYFKSLVRHMEEARALYRGWMLPMRDGEAPATDILEVLCAVRFNLDGFLHEAAKEILNAPPRGPDPEAASGGMFDESDDDLMEEQDEQPESGRSIDAT